MTQDPQSLPMIRLDDLLKRRGLVGSGGEAKIRIQCGEVRVNGEIETRRRKQIHPGDFIEFAEEAFPVTMDDFASADER